MTLLESEPAMSTELVQHHDPTPMQMLNRFGEQLTPEQVEKWMELQERWERNQAKKAFHIAMKACQDEMPVIVKDSKNTQTNSRYASLAQVKTIAKPIYTKHGFTLSFSEAESHLQNHKRTVCDVRHDMGHCVQYHVDLPVDGIGPKGNPIGGMNAVQGSVSSLSYGERVLTTMIFDLTIAETDTDGNRQIEPITEEQIATLKEWMSAIGADEARTLRWREVEKWADLDSQDYKEMLASFQATARKKGIEPVGMPQ